jgi:hypothetical protein
MCVIVKTVKFSHFKISLNYQMLVLLMLFLNSCQYTAVKPWERDILSQPEMQFSVGDMDLTLDDHFYFSKEGISGGRSFAGGGCGCN